MTITVARHLDPRPDAEEFADRLSKQVAGYVEELEESADMIDFTFSSALLALQAHSVADPSADRLQTWEATVTAMQVGSALFAVTGATEGVVECFVHDRMRTIPVIGPQSFANAGNWLSAFWLAVICRDPKRMTQLCEIPLERLRSPEGATTISVYHWVDVQQTYWLRRPGLVEKIMAAFEASDPEVARNTPLDALQGVMYPPLNLFYHFVRKLEEEFGPALAEALNLHKAYWTLTEERAADIDGALALGPLAMACLAYDGKLPIDVESPFIPKYLLTRDWVGEFPRRRWQAGTEAPASRSSKAASATDQSSAAVGGGWSSRVGDQVKLAGACACTRKHANVERTDESRSRATAGPYDPDGEECRSMSGMHSDSSEAPCSGRFTGCGGPPHGPRSTGSSRH